MSVVVSRAVWEMQLPLEIPKNKRSTIKLILAKLADNSDVNGKCWPSMAKISHECEVSERTVVRSIKVLSDLNIISVTTKRYGFKKRNTYYINIMLIRSLKNEYESNIEEDDCNPYHPPCDIQSNTCDIQSKPMDSVSHKPSLTIKEPSHADISKADEHVFSIDEIMNDFPMCSDAIHELTSLGKYNYRIYTGELTLSEWEYCESAMRSVDDFDMEYFTFWMKEKSPSMRKTPSLPNMLTDMNGTPFDQFYESAFVQEYEN